MNPLILIFCLYFIVLGNSVALEKRLSSRPTEYLKRGLASLPWTRDPFNPVLPQFSLSGIVARQMAFINGQWVRIGNKIGRYRIKQILSRSVVLQKEDREITLTLSP